MGSDLEVQIQERADEFESVLSKNKRLEDDLVAATSNKDELASSVSQLITNTNEMKNEIKIINMEHEKSRLKFEREKEELESAIEEKEVSLSILKKEVEEKSTLEQKLENEIAARKGAELNLKEVQSTNDQLKHDLAAAEIRYTDLEQETQLNGATEVKEALRAQKERYETNHKKIVDGQNEKFKAKLKEFAKLTEELLQANSQDLADIVKQLNGAKKDLCA